MSNSSKLYEDLMREAIKERNKLSTNTIIEVRKLYEEVANDLIKKAETARGGFTKAWTKDYEKYMRFKIMELDNALVNLTKDSIKSSAEIAATVNGDFISFINNKYELDIDKDFLDLAYSVNNDVIGKIIQGGLYKDNRSLSDRIWNYSNKNMNDIQHIITKGMAEQRPYKDIIKDLGAYVDPNAKKDWNFNRLYPSVSKKVDYNAVRLLRTSVNHAFFASNMSKAQDNKFVEGIKWNLSSAHFERMVKIFGEDICDDYANSTHGFKEVGVFRKDDVPLPHCNCLCYQTFFIPKSLEEIGKELGDWVRGGSDPTSNSQPKDNRDNNMQVNNSVGKAISTFTKANSKMEALEFAKNITGNKDFTFGDFSIANMNLINEAMFDCYKKINKPLTNLKEIANMPKGWGSHMQASYSKDKKRIYMKGGNSNTYGSSLEKSAIRDFSSGFSASGHKLSTLHHEVAHSIYYDLDTVTKGKIEDLFKETKHKAFLDWKEAGASSSGLTQADFQKKVLSKYAYQDNDPNEFFAEAFSQIASNKMRPVSRKVLSILKENYIK